MYSSMYRWGTRHPADFGTYTQQYMMHLLVNQVLIICMHDSAHIQIKLEMNVRSQWGGLATLCMRWSPLTGRPAKLPLGEAHPLARCKNPSPSHCNPMSAAKECVRKMYFIEVQPLPSLGPKSEPNLAPRFPTPQRSCHQLLLSLYEFSQGFQMDFVWKK